MLAIVDYKAGNQTSVRRALDYLHIPSVITSTAEDILNSNGIIFPGVGAAGQAMKELESSGLDSVLKHAVRVGIPLLGICLGCQILLNHSEENDTTTLGLIKGECLKFPDGLRQEDGTPAPVPHMGWNNIEIRKKSPLLQGITPSNEFYFVHSYYVAPAPEYVIATSTYGRSFCAVYGLDGLCAVQFHAEKSGRPGLKILQNFYEFCSKNN